MRVKKKYRNPHAALTEKHEPETVIRDYLGWSRYVCKKCKGDVFRVFSGEYMTAVECVTCDVASIVHEG